MNKMSQNLKVAIISQQCQIHPIQVNVIKKNHLEKSRNNNDINTLTNYLAIIYHIINFKNIINCIC